jgi:hypothetical protein
MAQPVPVQAKILPPISSKPISPAEKTSAFLFSAGLRAMSGEFGDHRLKLHAIVHARREESP